MKNSKLYRLSVFFAVIGLTLMYGSSLYLDIEKVDIGDIESSWTGKNVKISGEITSYTKSDGNVFMDVNDTTGTILVVIFDTGKTFSEGEKVNVTGHVELYEGQLEIIAKEAYSSP